MLKHDSKPSFVRLTRVNGRAPCLPSAMDTSTRPRPGLDAVFTHPLLLYCH
jgi:hypothetical protein